MNVNIGILFGYLDAAVLRRRQAGRRARQGPSSQPDWKKVFEPENVMAEVKAITQGRARVASRTKDERIPKSRL